MARVGAPYLPIRPAGHNPAPVPYFHELMKAQNMLPIGITALAASTGGEDETEDEEDIFTEEEKELLDNLPLGIREHMAGLLKEQKEKLAKTKGEAKDIQDSLKGKLKEKGLEYGLSEEESESMAESAVNRYWEKLMEGRDPIEAMNESFEELQILHGHSGQEHARGGLVGINELTRGL